MLASQWAKHVDYIVNNRHRKNHVRFHEKYDVIVDEVRVMLLCNNPAEDSIQEKVNDLNHALRHTSRFVYKSLHMNESSLAKGDTMNISKYLENACSVLQLLAKYVKAKTDGVEMLCQLFPEFHSGLYLVLRVFTHCKDSETLYGDNLGVMEPHLKELFRTCQELNKTLLDVLQHRLVFKEMNHLMNYNPRDTEILAGRKEDWEIFCYTMITSSSIGEVVIKLDLKTMAEHWKTYVAICEKYSNTLAVQLNYNRTLDVLSRIIIEHIESCVQDDQEEKALLRTFKVASFLMKILIKMCHIFKEVNCHHTSKIRLMITIKGNSEPFLRILDKSEQFMELMRSHVTTGVEALLAERIEHRFFALALQEEIEMFFPTDEHRGPSYKGPTDKDILGYTLVLISVMAAILQRDNKATRDAWLSDPLSEKTNIICCILRLLPHCHVWLMYGLKFNCWIKKSDPPKSCGLYEHLLSMTAAVAATVDNNQYQCIERSMLKVLLEGDEWASLFATDLWVILARYGPIELCVQQIACLTDIYNRLKEKESTLKSPQSIHLRSTIQRLFNTVPDEDKVKIYNDCVSEYNEPMCQELFVDYLPEIEAKEISESVFKKLQSELQKLLRGKSCNASDLHNLITTVRVAVKCPPTAELSTDAILKCWLKCYVSGDMSALLCGEETSVHGRQWFTDLVLALSEITKSLCARGAWDNKQLIQILNVLESIIDKSSSALKLSTASVLAGISTTKILNDPHKTTLCKMIAQMFRKLLKDNDSLVQVKTLVAFRHFSLHTDQECVIPLVVKNGDNKLKESLIYFMKNDYFKSISNTDWIERLKSTSDAKFIHKCKILEDNNVENNLEGLGNIKMADPNYMERLDNIEMADPNNLKGLSNFEMADPNNLEGLSNFDMGDIDSLFNNDDIEESTKKRIKVNSDEVESLLCRIERDVDALEGFKENVFSEEHSDRIAKVIEKIQNIL